MLRFFLFLFGKAAIKWQRANVEHARVERIESILLFVYRSIVWLSIGCDLCCFYLGKSQIIRCQWWTWVICVYVLLHAREREKKETRQLTEDIRPMMMVYGRLNTNESDIIKSANFFSFYSAPSPTSRRSLNFDFTHVVVAYGHSYTQTNANAFTHINSPINTDKVVQFFEQTSIPKSSNCYLVHKSFIIFLVSPCACVCLHLGQFYFRHDIPLRASRISNIQTNAEKLFPAKYLALWLLLNYQNDERKCCLPSIKVVKDEKKND